MVHDNYARISLILLEMVRKDYLLQDELAKTSDLLEGYHPELEKLHLENGRHLRRIISEIGWPTDQKVGAEGAAAAWIILMHAISYPDLQRECLPLLRELAEQKEVSASALAILEDRICYFEMRPQIYGTQFDFDEDDKLVPWTIADPEHVDDRRRLAGFPPLQEVTRHMQDLARHFDVTKLKPYNERLKERETWAKKVGWLKC